MIDPRRRYRVPDPLCRHRTIAGRVYAGDPNGGAYASTHVCDREACIADAKAWAFAVTHLEPTHARNADRDLDETAHAAGYVTDDQEREEADAWDDYDPDDPDWADVDEDLNRPERDEDYEP